MNDILHEISNKPRTAGVVVFLSLGIYFFVNTMAFPLDHNENMYVSAAYLLRSLEMYKDFAFLQMPYAPMLYNAVFRMTGVEHLLLVARACTLLFTILSCALLWLILVRHTRDFAVSLLAVFVFGFSYYLKDISAEAANYMMPMAATLLAFFLFQRVMESQRHTLLLMFLVGLSLAVAIGAKLYYGPFVFPFMVCSLIYPLEKRFRLKLFQQTAPLCVGLAVGLIPVAIYAFKYPEAFFFNNVQYHVLNSQWRGFDSGLNLAYRLESVLSMITLYPANAGLSVIMLLVIFRAFRLSGPPSVARSVANDPIVSLGFMLFVVGSLVAMIPLPVFVHYFAAGLPFAIIVGCALLKQDPMLKWPNGFRFVAVLAFALILGTAFVNFSQRLGSFKTISSWTGVSVHNVSMQIKAKLSESDSGLPIATLSPVFAIEAGLPIYPELATGPFLFRVGELMNPSDLKRFKGVSAHGLNALLTSRSPAAVITGEEGSLENPFIDYAVSSGMLEISRGDLKLFTRESLLSQKTTSNGHFRTILSRITGRAQSLPILLPFNEHCCYSRLF